MVSIFIWARHPCRVVDTDFLLGASRCDNRIGDAMLHSNCDGRDCRGEVSLIQHTLDLSQPRLLELTEALLLLRGVPVSTYVSMDSARGGVCVSCGSGAPIAPAATAAETSPLFVKLTQALLSKS